MSYITPNSSIYLLKGVPLNNTYEDTLHWGTLNTQTTYFASKTKYALIRQSYQRVKRGYLRVELKYEQVLDCNYMMFKNDSYENKWFYAFILEPEYINDNVTEIQYEIDVMQTWYFDYTLKECFIEREHTATDNIGENLVPENLEIGEYISDDMDGTGYIRDISLVVAATFDTNYTDFGGARYAGLFSGLIYNVFPNTTQGITDAVNFIHNAGAKQSEIVSVFYAPTRFVTQAGAAIAGYHITKTKNYTDIDGYVPKNKKLFTYPYNFLYVTNLQGISAVFPYEYFSGNTCDFYLSGDFTSNPTVLCAPENYKGTIINYDEMLTLSGFPQCAFNTDFFKAWLAQTAAALPGKLVSTAAQMAGARGNSSLRDAMLGGIPTAVDKIGGMLSETMVAAIQPLQAHGQQSSSTMAANLLLDFGFFHKFIRAEFAKIIDDYFNMYGYASHQVKIPNTNVRPYWTFTKTVGCRILAELPESDNAKICSIYDKGITFWTDPANVGDYSLNNAPANNSQNN